MSMIARSDDFMERGVAAMPHSIKSASSCGTQIPALSPCLICCTGFLNIYMDRIFFSCFRFGNSIISPTFIAPCKHVPVKTVPWPFIWKQWSMENKKSFELPPDRSGMSTLCRIWFTRSYTLLRELIKSVSLSLCGTALTEIIVAYSPNLVR